MTVFSHTSVSSKERNTVRLPLASNEHINAFTGAAITNYSGNISNGIVDSYANEPERTYVTNRPSVTITKDASASSAGTKGRGIYYWGATGNTYIVNNDTVYQNDYGSPCSVTGGGTAFAAGTEKVYFEEWESPNGKYLFIINPEGNQIFVILSTAATSLINMDDSIADTGTGAEPDSPFAAGDSWDVTGLPVNNLQTLCHGAVNLDSYLFLGCKNGRIYNSDVDDWLNWNTLGYVTAERENDQLLYIEKTKDHIAAFGERSIELFYDAANPTPASPLSNRTDIAHRIGIVSGQSAWADGDQIYFLGMKPQGDFSIYVLDNFVPQEKINTTLNTYLKHGRTEVSLYTTASGFSTGGHVYFILTIYNDQDKPQKSIVYDVYTNFWYEWEVNILGLEQFPIVGWSIRTPEAPVTAEGIFSTGDVFRISDNFEPVDSTDLSNYYFLEDYLEDSGIATDYMEGYTVDEKDDTIPWSILIDNFDGLSSDDKFMHSAKYVGSIPKTHQEMTLEWSDDGGITWLSSTIDIYNRTQINRMGKFDRRKFKLRYSGTEQVRAEAIDVTYTVGES